MVLSDEDISQALKALVRRGVLSPEDADTVRKECVFTPEDPVYVVLTSEPGPEAWVTEPRVELESIQPLAHMLDVAYNAGHEAGFDAGYAFGIAERKQTCGDNCCGRHH